MTKTIWFISKYCRPPKKKLGANRGWFLMKELSSKGYNSLIISSEIQKKTYTKNFKSKIYKYIQNGVKIVILKTLYYSNNNSIFRILSWFQFEWQLFFLDKSLLPKPNAIIISSLSILTILNGFLIKKKFNCKLVFEIRDIWPLSLIEYGGYSKYNPFIIFLKFLEKWGYKNSDEIVGTMPNLKSHVANVLGYSKKVYCIPMGFTDEMLKKEKISKKYIDKYLNTKYFNIVYAGKIGISNSLETFFKAAQLISKHTRIRFVVVGDGVLKEYYKKKYIHLTNLVFAPKVNKNQVQSILTCANVLYFATSKNKVWKYGQSLNKLIDYMISSKPIIASYSGYRSMINEANCGFFIPAEDVNFLVKTIKKIIKMKKSELDKIGLRGRKWLYANRKYKKLADDYLKILF